MPKRSSDKRFFWVPGVVAATILVVGGVFVRGVTARLETFVYDRALRMEGATAPSDLAIIAIDDTSLARLGAWPWSQGVHAQLLERLHTSGAGLVAFTVPLPDSQSDAGVKQLRAAIELLQGDEISKSIQGEQLKQMLDNSVATLDQGTLLANAIDKHVRVLLPIDVQLSDAGNTRSTDKLSELNADSSFLRADADALSLAPVAADVQPPSSAIASHAQGIAHAYFAADADEVIRDDYAAIRVGEKLLPSLAVSITAGMAGINPSQVTLSDEGLLTVGNVRLPLDSELRWHPAFFPSEGPRAVSSYSYWQVLRGEVPAEQLRDKTVLIGFTDRASAMGLQLRTPLGQRATPVQLVASAVSSLRLDMHYRNPGWAVALQWLLSLGVLAAAIWVFPSFKLSASATTMIVGAIALIVFEIGVLNAAGIWIKLTLPAMALVGALLGVAGVRYAKHLGSPSGQNADSVESLRMLGLTFQGQGQLDLAYETFRRCPNDTQSLNLLYGIGQDYERRRQFNKAADVYAHISSVDAEYKDALQRRDRMRRADTVQGASPRSPAKPGAARGPEYADPPTIPVPLNHASRKQSLGRYEIERELGKGAMGVVYLGRDPKINRVVAIKAIALAEEFAEEDLADARARFFREAEMAGRLNHPGIVTVYDAGEDRGLAYIAMEYLRGEHLSHYAEPIHLLPVPRVLSLVARVAEALDYAHKQNVVHRDIKPANIMFNKDSDELKITDFGIARLTDTSRTKTGIVLGTPSFMSPEQLEGRPLDGRSDLFALGITLYQLLTGQLPFRADSMTRLMQKIATEPHVPVRSLRPELPDMAEQIMERSLAKSATDRYQTGAEMAAAMRTCLRLSQRKEAIAR